VSDVQRSQRQKLLRFLAVGGAGFCLDLGILLLLTQADFSAYGARAFSLSCSITCTWLLNRQFSFGASGDHKLVEYGRYGLVALIAAAVNYGVYALFLLITAPIIAMMAGSAAAILLTFTGYDRWVFARSTDQKTSAF
jgi:putative flippase GtrA